MSKNTKLIVGIIMDLIGMGSFALPFIGELSDIIWAPISLMVMRSMYSGKEGNIAGTVSFIEEILPGLDFIPTFTLTWFYVYIWKKETKLTSQLLNK